MATAGVVAVHRIAQPPIATTKATASRSVGAIRSDRGPTTNRITDMPKTSPAVVAAAIPAPASVWSITRPVAQYVVANSMATAATMQTRKHHAGRDDRVGVERVAAGAGAGSARAGVIAP